MIRVLFVDDDRKQLEMLQNRLKPLAEQWQMRFVDSIAAAMEALDAEPADAVITEIRAGVLDGAELLRRVRDHWPATVRLVLSSQTAQEAVMRALPVAHQFLTKPCDVSQLLQIVTRSCALQTRLYSGGVMASLGALKSLPSVPRLYQQLSTELDSGRATPKSVATIIEQDMAMTARLLQLVNSAYFGLSRRIVHIRDAVTMLGFEPIRMLVAQSELFRGMSKMCSPIGFSLEEIQQHSQRVGGIAATLLNDREASRNVLCAAMLHDIGQVVLAVSMPEAYARSRAIAAKQGISLHAAEQLVFECTHADIGAHVLALWGLPTALVEAVAFHHQPVLAGAVQFGMAGAIHVADAIEHARQESGAELEAALTATIDRDYLRDVGKLDALPGWIAAKTAELAA